MSTSYLIEIRLFGRANIEIREIIKNISEKYKIPISQHVVPHITIVGGFSTNDENRLIRDFNLVCCCSELTGYTIEGKGSFNNTGVIKLNVQPNKELNDYRLELRDKLQKYCTLSKWDFIEPFEFHVTILNHVDQNKIRYIMQNFDFDKRYSHRMLRATLLKRDSLSNKSKILCEYDFLHKRMLSRNEAKDKQILTKTFCLLKEGKAKKKNSLWSKILCYVRFWR